MQYFRRKYLNSKDTTQRFHWLSQKAFSDQISQYSKRENMRTVPRSDNFSKAKTNFLVQKLFSQYFIFFRLQLPQFTGEKAHCDKMQTIFWSFNHCFGSLIPSSKKQHLKFSRFLISLSWKIYQGFQNFVTFPPSHMNAFLRKF